MKIRIASTRTTRALAGLAADYLGTGMNIALSFVLTPWLVFLLKSEVYGFWIVATQALFWLNLLDGGSGLYLVQAISKYQGDAERINRAIATVFWVYAVLAVPTLLIGWSIAPTVCHWSHLTGATAAAGIIAFRICAISATITLVLAPTFQAVLFGFQKIALVNTIVTSVAAGALVLGVILVATGGSVVSLAVAQLVCTWAGAGVTVFMARRLCSASVAPRFFDRKQLREVFRFSAYFQMSKAAFLGNTFSDGLLIVGALGPAAVTTYNLTQKLATTSTTFITKVSGAVMPGLAEIFADKDFERLQRVTYRLVHLLARVSILAATLLILLNHRFINLWIGAQFFGGLVLTALFGYVVVRNGLIGTFSTYLFSTGELKAWGWLSLTEALTKIGLTLALLPIAGLLAPAIGTVAGGLITGVYLPVKIGSMVRLRLRDLFWRGFVPVFKTSLPTVIVAVVLAVVVPDSWRWLGIAAIAAPALLVNSLSFDRAVLGRLRTEWASRNLSPEV
ncbi:MAG TPA: oligosaccharide flippase family protein [Thermoanaerobaculia bacterium]